MQTISVRVPEDDLQWLLGIDAAGARSPSDRIRSLIAASRRQSEGMADYVACVAMLRDFLRPFENMLRTAERRHGIHSEVVAAIEQSLPEMMAETIAFAPVNEQEETKALAQVESNLAARTMRLCVRLLRMSITQSTPAFDPAVLDPYLPEIIELAGIIQGRRPSSTLTKES